MKRLKDDIANKTFKTCYLLYGTERYLVTQYRGRLKNALIPEDDTMNLNAFEGKSLDWPEIMSIGSTLPFFADHRVILLDGTGLFKSAGEQGKQMAAWIRELPETTTVIFTETDVDSRSAMFKAVNETGTACEMNGPDENELRTFIAIRFKKEGRQIRERDAAYLLETVGSDMQNLCNEIDKLVAYTLGRDTITANDIDEVCVRQINGRIFDLTDAVAAGNKDAALHNYYLMLQMREAPIKVFASISNHFNRLLLTKDLLSHGRNNRDVAASLGMKQYPADKLCGQSRNFSIEKLRSAVELGVKLDKDFKSGNLDPDMVAEFYIIQLLYL